jgi:hypothetical protein
MALAIQICYEMGLVQEKEQPRDEMLQHWILATFGAVFCSQGKDEPVADLIFPLILPICILFKCPTGSVHATTARHLM